MSKYKIPEEKGMDMLREAFSEIETVEGLIRPDIATETDRIAAGDLYGYAMGETVQSVRIKSALLRFPAMRRALDEMLGAQAVYAIPEAIAASTDAYPERRTNGCRLRVEVSRAEGDQVYLIIEVDEGHAMPERLTLCGLDGQVEHLDLAAPRRGAIQVMVTIGSGIPEMLKDPKTALYLR